jgi:hypothetical protein
MLLWVVEAAEMQAAAAVVQVQVVGVRKVLTVV